VDSPRLRFARSQNREATIRLRLSRRRSGPGALPWHCGCCAPATTASGSLATRCGDLLRPGRLLRPLWRCSQSSCAPGNRAGSESPAARRGRSASSGFGSVVNPRRGLATPAVRSVAKPRSHNPSSPLATAIRTRRASMALRLLRSGGHRQRLARYALR